MHPPSLVYHTNSTNNNNNSINASCVRGMANHMLTTLVILESLFHCSFAAAPVYEHMPSPVVRFVKQFFSIIDLVEDEVSLRSARWSKYVGGDHSSLVGSFRQMLIYWNYDYSYNQYGALFLLILGMIGLLAYFLHTDLSKKERWLRVLIHFHVGSFILYSALMLCRPSGVVGSSTWALLRGAGIRLTVWNFVWSWILKGVMVYFVKVGWVYAVLATSDILMISYLVINAYIMRS